MPKRRTLRLALRPRLAARAIGISERTLARLVKAGEVPFTRIGSAVVFPVRELRRWLSARVTEGAIA